MKRMTAFILIFGLAVGAFAAVHPKLIEAERLLAVAEEKVAAAQHANEFDMDGWALKAEEAISGARKQIHEATMAAEGRPSHEVGALVTESPEADGYFKRHPNLAEAQRYVNAAYQLIAEAQKDNGFDMEGHAQKAKDLLDVANEAIRKAARADRK